MKTLFPIFTTLAAGLCLSFSVIAQLAEPIRTNGVVSSIDLDQDGNPDATYVARSSPSPQNKDYLHVTLELFESAAAKFVRKSSQILSFELGDEVGPASRVIFEPFTGKSDLTLIAYDAELLLGVQWKYFDLSDALPDKSFTNRIDLIVGVRFTDDVGPHFGWIRFRRSNTHFTTPWEVQEHTVHPLPNEPIGAGLPPTPPPVTPTFDATEGTLSLNWDARFPGLVLEVTETLTEPVEWKPVPDASGPPAVLPVPAGDRFYRLRNQ
jgi:hypothetical protein